MKTTIRVVDWIIFLVLFGLAVYWTVDAIEKYNLKRTTMSQSFEPITQSPTIVICWDSIYHYVYKDHFSVWYQSNLFGIEKGAHLLELDEEKTFNKTKETVLLQQSQLSCFKISSKLEMPPKPEDSRWIQVVFKNWINTSSSAFKGINIYITDEANSYGATFKNWYDGKSMKVRASLGKRYFFGLTYESSL